MKQTIKQLLERADLPAGEAEILLAHTLARPREFVIAHTNERVGFLQWSRFLRAAARRRQGESVARIIGRKEFFRLNFFVNKHTLIPRPDTEILVEAATQMLAEQPADMLIDVGTGSGCILISILKHMSSAKNNTAPKHMSLSVSAPPSIPAFATDISGKALAVARKNAKQHGVDITFLKGNLLKPFFSYIQNRTKNSVGIAVPKNQNSYSRILITANLPYLTQEQFNSEPSIWREPASALVADHSGLALYKKLLEQIHELQKNLPAQADRAPHITALFEIDPSQTIQLKKYIKKTFAVEAKVIQDLSGRERMIVFSIF